MNTLITFRLLVETSECEHTLDAAVRQTLEMIPKSMKVYSIKTLGKEASFGKPTKDESIRLMPRRIHFGDYSHSICHKDPYRTIPLSRLTKDWAKVTCKPCLRYKKEMTGQQELFA
jgi:hypothetical protein